MKPQNPFCNSMATSSECEAITASGAGGKFRNKTFRRAHYPATPYDRLPAVTRGMIDSNNGSNRDVSLFRKLVVGPASKIIAYGAHRFFASVFQKRFSSPPEVNGELGDDHQMATADNQCGAQSSGRGNGTHSLHNPTIDGISELEQLLMQKTFSRSEINHLTVLLQSRVVECSLMVDVKRFEEIPSNFSRHWPVAIRPAEVNTKYGDKSHGVMSTPVVNARVIEEHIASPAELAKAYMGNRPSKVSFSMLGMHSQVANDSMTPKSRGRSAVYMAHTPDRSIYPRSVQKGTGLTNNGSGGSLMPSSHSVVEQYKKSEPKPMGLKRRNSVLDDDVGSVSPIRRIRQKSNLLSSRIRVTAHEMDTGFDYSRVSSKQKLPSTSIVEPNNMVSKIAGKDEVNSVPAVNYAHVLSKSSEVAARIYQHLEKLTPKEKSSESKLGALGEKSLLRSTTSMLCGQSRSVGEVDSLKLLLDFQDGQKLSDRLTPSPHAQVSTFPRTEVEQTYLKESVGRPSMLTPDMKNKFLESLEAPGFSSSTSHSVVKNAVAQPPSKRTFKMSSQEDGDINSY